LKHYKFSLARYNVGDKLFKKKTKTNKQTNKKQCNFSAIIKEYI